MHKQQAIKNMEEIIDFLELIEPIERGGFELTEKAKTTLEMLKSSVSQSVVDQIKWERNVALSQLNEIGKSLGEKMDDIVSLLKKGGN